MITTKQQILDIAMNLNRIGNWAADDFERKQKRITLFLEQTRGYIHETQPSSVQFQKTFEKFKREFEKLYHEGVQKPSDVDIWAEKMMTWGNILTHRSALLLN